MSQILQERLNNATLEQARAWESTEEKFTFCIDLLEISAHDADADFWVNALEDRFERMIEFAA